MNAIIEQNEITGIYLLTTSKGDQSWSMPGETLEQFTARMKRYYNVINITVKF